MQLKKHLCISIFILISVASFQLNAKQVFGGLTLGEQKNESLQYKDLSLEYPSSDGTLTFAYLPKAKMKINFDQHTAYITPITKIVAIIEFAKIFENNQDCESTSRFFESEVVPNEYPKFKSIAQLNEDGLILTKNGSDSAIKFMFSPEEKYSLQFGCVQRLSKASQYAFVVSFSDSSYIEIAKKENDRLIATNK